MPISSLKSCFRNNPPKLRQCSPSERAEIESVQQTEETPEDFLPPPRAPQASSPWSLSSQIDDQADHNDDDDNDSSHNSMHPMINLIAPSVSDTTRQNNRLSSHSWISISDHDSVDDARTIEIENARLKYRQTMQASMHLSLDWSAPPENEYWNRFWDSGGTMLAVPEHEGWEIDEHEDEHEDESPEESKGATTADDSLDIVKALLETVKDGALKLMNMAPEDSGPTTMVKDDIVSDGVWIKKEVAENEMNDSQKHKKAKKQILAIDGLRQHPINHEKRHEAPQIPHVKIEDTLTASPVLSFKPEKPFLQALHDVYQGAAQALTQMERSRQVLIQ